jgi:hypothetical protein
MRQNIVRFGSGALFVLGITLAGAAPADAQSVMKQCGDQWKAAKAAGTTNGQTWRQFLAQCRANLKTAGMGGAAGGPAPAAAPAAPAPTSTAAQAPAASTGKTTAQCDAEYAANKAAIKASHQTKRAFVAACRAGTETIPQGTAAAPAPAPMPAPSAAPAPAPAPAPMAPAPSVAPTGAGQFASDQQAHARCPSDTVVWVNNDSHVYHFPGTRYYGHTKQGVFMCEADAKAAGDRAAENEHHP